MPGQSQHWKQKVARFIQANNLQGSQLERQMLDYPGQENLSSSYENITRIAQELGWVGEYIKPPAFNPVTGKTARGQGEGGILGPQWIQGQNQPGIGQPPAITNQNNPNNPPLVPNQATTANAAQPQNIMNQPVPPGGQAPLPTNPRNRIINELIQQIPQNFREQNAAYGQRITPGAGMAFRNLFGRYANNDAVQRILNEWRQLPENQRGDITPEELQQNRNANPADQAQILRQIIQLVPTLGRNETWEQYLTRLDLALPANRQLRQLRAQIPAHITETEFFRAADPVGAQRMDERYADMHRQRLDIMRNAITNVGAQRANESDQQYAQRLTNGVRDRLNAMPQNWRDPFDIAELATFRQNNPPAPAGPRGGTRQQRINQLAQEMPREQGQSDADYINRLNNATRGIHFFDNLPQNQQGRINTVDLGLQTAEQVAQENAARPRHRQQILADLQRPTTYTLDEYNAREAALTPEEREIAASWNDAQGGNPPVGTAQRRADEERTARARAENRWGDLTGYLVHGDDIPHHDNFLRGTNRYAQIINKTPQDVQIIEQQAAANNQRVEEEIARGARLRESGGGFFGEGTPGRYRNIPTVTETQHALNDAVNQEAVRRLGQIPGTPNVPAPVQVPGFNAQPQQAAQQNGPFILQDAHGNQFAGDLQGNRYALGTDAQGNRVALDPRTGAPIPLIPSPFQPQANQGQQQQFYGVPGMAAYQAPIGQPQQIVQPLQNQAQQTNVPYSAITPNQAFVNQPGPQGFILPNVPLQQAQPGTPENILGRINNAATGAGNVGQGSASGIARLQNLWERLQTLGPAINRARNTGGNVPQGIMNILQELGNFASNVSQGVGNAVPPAQQVLGGGRQMQAAFNNQPAPGGPGMPGGGPGGPGGPAGGGGPYGPLPVWGVPMPYAENQYIRQFYEQTVPSLAERFTALGGGQRSSAFRQAALGAGGQLGQNLAAQRERYNLATLPYQSEQQRLAEQARQYNLQFTGQQQQQQFANQMANQAQQGNLFGGLAQLGQGAPQFQTVFQPGQQAGAQQLLNGAIQGLTTGLGIYARTQMGGLGG